MTFPSCRGSAYVTAELRGLKPFISSDLPLAVAWQLQHPATQKQTERDRNRNTTSVSLLSHCQLCHLCHLYVTCWSLAGNFEGALKVTDQTLILRKKESSSLV